MSRIVFLSHTTDIEMLLRIHLDDFDLSPTLHTKLYQFLHVSALSRAMVITK